MRRLPPLWEGLEEAFIDTGGPFDAEVAENGELEHAYWGAFCALWGDRGIVGGCAYELVDDPFVSCERSAGDAHALAVGDGVCTYGCEVVCSGEYAYVALEP